MIDACAGDSQFTDICKWKRRGGVLRTVVVGVVFLVVVIGLLLWLAGVFHHKVGGEQAQAAVGRPVGETKLVEVQTIQVPVIESAVGSIQAVHETNVASKILAKVMQVNVKAGQKVTKGEVLVKLDDTDLVAKKEQAEAAVAAARADRDQAKIELDRIRDLYSKDAATRIELDRAESAFKAAEANLRKAEKGLNEAEVVVSYATIRSPIDGAVIDKKVEEGDTVSPGQVLLSLYDPSRMQLVASVRESLTQRLDVGQAIDVRIEALNKLCQGTVSEIVPEAERESRTFSVKVTGPCPKGIYTGMFGRLLIPLDQKEVLVIPRSAVREVGQLNMVEVAVDGRLIRRAVQLGRDYDDRVQVLSGLEAGERVALRPVAGGSADKGGSNG